MPGFLYERITKGRPGRTGTLAEPDGAPEPRFALQSTVNWMRARVLVIQDEGSDWASMNSLYQRVQRFSGPTDRIANTIFEQLLMSLAIAPTASRPKPFMKGTCRSFETHGPTIASSERIAGY